MYWNITGLYPSDYASSSSWFLSETWQLLYIHLELHCKTIAYKVTTTIPIDYKLTYTKLETVLMSFPSCKCTNFTVALCNQVSQRNILLFKIHCICVTVFYDLLTDR